MKHKIIGDNDCPLVEIQLAEDETVRIERGCMAYMSNVELEGRMNTSKKGIGGMFSAIGRFPDQRRELLHYRSHRNQRSGKNRHCPCCAGQDLLSAGR